MQDVCLLYACEIQTLVCQLIKILLILRDIISTCKLQHNVDTLDTLLSNLKDATKKVVCVIVYQFYGGFLPPPPLTTKER